MSLRARRSSALAPACALAAPALARRSSLRLRQPQRRCVATPTDAQPASEVDESALRYYARNHQMERVEAEIRRLQTLHPGWTPPDDLFSANPVGSDEQAFWDLFGADRLDELEARASPPASPSSRAGSPPPTSPPRSPTSARASGSSTPPTPSNGRRCWRSRRPKASSSAAPTST